MRVETDNSACKKAIESFIFIFQQWYKGHESCGGESTAFYSNKVHELDTIVVPRFDTNTRTHYITVPTNLPISYNGKLITTKYYIRVWVKYDAWNESGPGRDILVPVEIYCKTAPPPVIEQEIVTAPAGWAPEVANEVHFGIPVDGDQDQMLL